MTKGPEIGDGLEALNRVIKAREIARLVGALARWVDPATFKLLPVWFPETARKQKQYKAGSVDIHTIRGQPKYEGNTKANQTIARALGTPSKSRPHWTTCHIWGNDDSSFVSDYSEVNDPRYYSCPANMVLLPTPIKAFTDSVPEMKAALRLAAYQLYGFLPEGREIPGAEEAGEWLPNGWDRGEVSGIRCLSPRIETSARKRANKILDGYNQSPGNYPHAQVKRVMDYWAKKIPEFTFGGAL